VHHAWYCRPPCRLPNRVRASRSLHAVREYRAAIETKGTRTFFLDLSDAFGWKEAMPRIARIAPGGYVYHALNRGVARLALFENDGDFEAFERVLVLAVERVPLRILGYCLMPNHWHFVLWPQRDGELTAFLRWLTHAYAALACASSHRRRASR